MCIPKPSTYQQLQLINVDTNLIRVKDEKKGSNAS